jgi:DNA-binding beta-propeller fold protein YncE
VNGLAVDGRGHIYLALSSNQISEYSLDGILVTQWQPVGSEALKVALDAQGNVYVTEPFNNSVQKFSGSGEPLALWGGKRGSAPGKFNFPLGIAIDGAGNVYVADNHNGRIQKLSAQGMPLTEWSSSGGISPYDLALNSSGDLYVTDLASDSVVEFSPDGRQIARIGRHGSGPGEINGARGIVVDKEEDLYVDDTGNNRIEKFSASGQFLAQWLGPTSSPFDAHTDIALAANGDLYVSVGSAILVTSTG